MLFTVSMSSKMMGEHSQRLYHVYLRKILIEQHDFA